MTSTAAVLVWIIIVALAGIREDVGLRRARISAITLAYFLAACGGPTKDVYNTTEVGQIQEVREGRIVQSRFIDIDEKDSGRGTVAGGLAGGLGSLLAVGGGFGLAAFLLGSAVGAVAGYVVEDVVTDRDGIEYIISLDDGSTATIVQNRGDEDELLPPGTEIFLQYGNNYTRLIERPKNMPVPWNDPDAWVNPDDLPPESDSNAENGRGSGPQTIPSEPPPQVPSPDT